MEATVIDGQNLAKSILSELNKEVLDWVSGGNRTPKMRILYVGEAKKDMYIQGVLEAASNIGIDVEILDRPKDIRDVELLADIRKLNEDYSVDAVVVEIPESKHLNIQAIYNAVSPEKDVEGRNVVNVGRLVLNQNTIVPSTAAAVREILERYDIQTRGKNAVVCGRSQDLGLPIATMLCNDASGELPGLNATTSVCHEFTSRDQLSHLTKTADIVITSCGIPKLIKPDMLKEGVCVIDGGCMLVTDDTTGKKEFVGDVDFEEVSKISGQITPVPGGVGPVVTAMTLMNVLKLVKKEVAYDVFEPGAALNVALYRQEAVIVVVDP
ncbi:hypothetical protein ANN_15765 [Periplaneta americana]|uniref:Methenyltetrahydrofolate cyclohydrolase n=1 Tax=Periplaneta americana TaxID=6978 RepID=A0ABQ8SIH7_PERAM|nr:hypothetical protein ANN_15765 [Periplaneta americana]